MPRQPKPKTLFGFNLIELLVIIAILGMLAALLGSSLTRARQKALRIQCLGNLHQLGAGLQIILASDHASQRHQGRANVVFCDGHVESPTLKYVFEDTNDTALVRWNRDHQPTGKNCNPPKPSHSGKTSSRQPAKAHTYQHNRHWFHRWIWSHDFCVN